jgi:hypothetical protein
MVVEDDETPGHPRGTRWLKERSAFARTTGAEINEPGSFGPLLTEQDLAARHGRSVKTLRNLRVKGGYVPYLKIGRHVRYRLQDVLEYESRCLRSSTSVEGSPDGV